MLTCCACGSKYSVLISYLMSCVHVRVHIHMCMYVYMYVHVDLHVYVLYDAFANLLRTGSSVLQLLLTLDVTVE